MELQLWQPSLLLGHQLTWIQCYKAPLSAGGQDLFIKLTRTIRTLISMDEDMINLNKVNFARLLIKTTNTMLIQQCLKIKINGTVTMIRMITEASHSSTCFKCLWCKQPVAGSMESEHLPLGLFSFSECSINDEDELSQHGIANNNCDGDTTPLSNPLGNPISSYVDAKIKINRVLDSKICMDEHVMSAELGNGVEPIGDPNDDNSHLSSPQWNRSFNSPQPNMLHSLPAHNKRGFGLIIDLGSITNYGASRSDHSHQKHNSNVKPNFMRHLSMKHMEQEMEKKKGRKSEDNEEEKWVHDASVDYKGRVPLRDSTGGLSLLTMSQFIPSLKACNYKDICDQPRKFHVVVFFVALYCIALGTGGFKPCLQSFGADQFDDEHLEERRKKMSFFNWWTFVLSLALLLGATAVVYVQDFVSWGVACLILTMIMVLTFIAFNAGMPFYRYRHAEGNPFMPILQVLVAAIRKRNMSCPSNPDLLYELPKSDKSQGRLLSHTSRLRFLDKAAIVEEKYSEQKVSPWRLRTVTRVEETKLILNVVPVWLTSLLVGVCVAQSSTLFVKQAASMNLNISHKFKIPPASMSTLSAFGSIIFVPIYDRIIVPIMRKVTGNERGISILTRIGIGSTLSVILMFVTALVETKRLRLAETMSVLWLIPQYLILGLQYAFSLVGLQEYFYDQVPDSMRSLGMALYLSVLGTGFYLSSFLIIIVDHVTGKNGKSWIGKDVNSSRLDKFYWMLAVVNALNLCLFLLFAKRYTYKTVQRRARESETDNGVVTMA
ncbi:hypothetical protein Fmac_014510 [Flemingia macrophylla]|uniref:Uncharacterized protein n=1 Tax=Flemingia macrophylla TaxID=520843 RepID=A0ABD1MBX8_9FABA